MTRKEKIKLLRKAQEKLFRVIEIIEVVFPDDDEVNAYLIPRLKIAASEDHDFLTDALNIDKLIRIIKEKGSSKKDTKEVKRKKKRKGEN